MQQSDVNESFASTSQKLTLKLQYNNVTKRVRELPGDLKALRRVLI